MTAQRIGYRILDLGPLARRVDPYGDTLAPAGPRAFVSALYRPTSRARPQARADRMNADYGGDRYTVVSIWDDDPDGLAWLGVSQ